MLNTEIQCHDTCKLFLNDSGKERAHAKCGKVLTVDECGMKGMGSSWSPMAPYETAPKLSSSIVAIPFYCIISWIRSLRRTGMDDYSGSMWHY